MNISEFKTRLAQKIHGQSLNKVQDVDGLIVEAAGNVLNKIDPVETKRITPLTNGLYDQVYSYAVPVDLKKDRIIQIRPQGERTRADNFHQTYDGTFSLRYENNSFTVEDNSGLRSVKISKSLTQGITINDANGITSNGTWAAGGDASNIATDTVNYVSGSGSIRFDLNASGSAGYVENSTMQSVDLSGYYTDYANFIPVYIPSSAVTSITVRWGSSSSDYYSLNATTTQEGTAFSTASWNLIRLNRASATETGSVDDTAIDYVRVTFNYNGTAVTGCRIDNIVARIPTMYEMVYYSKYLFRNTSGTWLEEPTALDDSDEINLDIDGINLLLYETAYLVAQEIAGEDSAFDIDFWRLKRDETWNTYMAANKSEASKRRQSYYRMPIHKRIRRIN